jgi:hypothetical protein
LQAQISKRFLNPQIGKLAHPDALLLGRVAGPSVGMAVNTARAMLHGKGHDVWEMIVENIP